MEVFDLTRCFHIRHSFNQCVNEFRQRERLITTCIFMHSFFGYEGNKLDTLIKAI